MQYVLVKRRVDGPSVPELGMPVALTFDSVRVPLNRPSTGPNPVAAYQLERSTDGSTWAVIATGASIFGNPPAQYVDGGRAAATTYYYRARTTDTAGRVSAYCATVSVTTPTTSRFSPNRPHLGTGYITPAQWGNSGNWQRLAQASRLDITHYNGAEAVAGRTLRSAIEGIKAVVPASLGANPVHAAYIVHDEVAKVDGSSDRLRVKLAAESWYLYVVGQSGAIADSSFSSSLHLVNRTSGGAFDSNGDNWVRWYARLMAQQNVTGEPGNSPNPSLDGMFLDNCYGSPRIAADWDRNGTTDSTSDPGYQLATREGIKAHFDYMRIVWPTARAQLGNISDLPDRMEGGLYASSFVPDFSSVAPLFQVIDGGLSEYLIDNATLNGELGTSKEWQERNNGLTGFHATRNQMRFLDGVVRNPCLNMYSLRDVTGDGSAADNQRLRFGAAAVCVCSDGAIDDRRLLSWPTLPLIYTNNTGVGWLGQPVDTPRYDPLPTGVYVRQFANGFVAVNPRNNGAKTFFVNVATRNVETGVTHAANAAIPIADRDGVFLERN